MRAIAENVLAQALQMPAKERATIAERVLASLDPEIAEAVGTAWRQEVQRRLTEIENGEVICLPWAQIIQRLKANAYSTS